MPRRADAPSFPRGNAGGVTYLERAGDGPAVVFLHGIGSSSDSFLPLFECIPAGARLIAWNAPGYLDSKLLSVVAPTADDYAQALEQFLTDLNLQAVHLVGHSLGTLIGAAFALRAQKRVLSLTLASAAQGYGIAAGAPLPAQAAARLDDLAQLGAANFANVRAPRLVFEPDRNPAIVARVCAEMARIRPAGYAQAVHMLAAGTLSDMVARIACKPAFIIGTEDQVTPIAQTTAAADAWASAHGEMPDVVSIPKAGHAVYVQAPDAFAAALFRLVPDLRPRAPTHAEGEYHDD